MDDLPIVAAGRMNFKALRVACPYCSLDHYHWEWEKDDIQEAKFWPRAFARPNATLSPRHCARAQARGAQGHSVFRRLQRFVQPHAQRTMPCQT